MLLSSTDCWILSYLDVNVYYAGIFSFVSYSTLVYVVTLSKIIGEKLKNELIREKLLSFHFFVKWALPS